MGGKKKLINKRKNVNNHNGRYDIMSQQDGHRSHDDI